jgi:Ribonuclease G/E
MPVDALIIDTRDGLTRAALLEQGRPVEFRVETPSSRGRAGAVFLGRVRKVAPGLQAAFVDIGLERDGFLARADSLGAVNEGDAVVVQVLRDAEADKGPKLSMRLDGPPEVADGKVPRPLIAAPDLPDRLRREFPDIVVRLEPFPEDLDEAFDAALAPVVPLASGGSLVIQETAALVAIDVDAGPGAAGGQEEARLSVNLEAAREVARQIRLRDLAGLLVVDFLKLKREGGRRKLLATLRTAVKEDPCEVHVHGFTALGLVEMTRRKRGESLAARMSVPCPSCGGRGRAAHPDRVAAAILNALEREARARPGGRLRVRAAPAVVDLLPELGHRFGHPPAIEPRADFSCDRFEILPETP